MASGAGNVTIHIGSNADTRGFDKATDALGRSKAAADQFVESIKAGVGIDIGGRIVSSLAAIPNVLQSALARGVEFNFTMGDSEKAIAQVVGQFQKLDKQAAKQVAAGAMQQMIDLEPKTAAGLTDLVQGFMATTASASAAGVSVEQNVDLVGKMANALANANIPAEQLSQEMRAIFTGNITPDAALGKLLNITSADVAKAKEAGNLYEFLTEKVGTLGEAGDSSAVRMSTLKSTVDKLLGEMAKPVSDVLFEAFADLNEQMASPEGKQALKDLGFEIAALVKQGVNLTKWAIENADTLVMLAKGATAVAIAFAAVKVKNILVGLGQMLAGLWKNTIALDTETAALSRNTAGQIANAASAKAAGASRAGGAASGAASGAAGRGLPYSKAAYESARAGGASASDALNQARRAMYLAAKEGGKSAGIVQRLTGTLGRLNVGLKGANAASGGLLTMLAAMAAYKGSKFMIDQMADMGAGIGSGRGALFHGTSVADVENSAVVGNDLGEKTTALRGRVKGIESEEERDSLAGEIVKLTQEISSQINSDGRHGETTDAQVEAMRGLNDLMKLLGNMDLPTEAQLEENPSLRRNAPVKDVENVAALNEYKDQRAKEFSDRQRNNLADLAVETAAQATGRGADSDAITKRIAKLEADLAEKPEISDQNALLADVESRDEERGKLKSQINDLADAEMQRAEDLADYKLEQADELEEKEISALEDRLKRVEAEGELRLAQIDGAGLSEEELTKKRKAAEDEIAAQRKALEDEIAGKQDESDDARLARLAQYDAEAQRRANSLASALKPKEEDGGDRWKEGVTGGSGRYDLRSRNTYDTGGNLAMKEGVLQDGYSQSTLGTISGPSRLPPSISNFPTAATPMQGSRELAAGAAGGGAGVDTAALESEVTRLKTELARLGTTAMNGFKSAATATSAADKQLAAAIANAVSLIAANRR